MRTNQDLSLQQWINRLARPEIVMGGKHSPAKQKPLNWTEQPNRDHLAKQIRDAKARRPASHRGGKVDRVQSACPRRWAEYCGIINAHIPYRFRVTTIVSRPGLVFNVKIGRRIVWSSTCSIEAMDLARGLSLYGGFTHVVVESELR